MRVTGCPAAWLLKKMENRKLRIEKIAKIGNFVLKNGRKIGKSIVLLSTKIASLHPIRVIIKAMSPQLLRSRDLDHFYNIIPFSILLQILASPAKK